MFMLAVTICLSLDAKSCSAIISKRTFVDEESCKTFALQEYPALLQAFPIVAALQCLPMPGESA